MNIILELLVQCDTNINLNLCIYVSDLYFMVKWFCLILKTICWTNAIIGILVPCDAKIYLMNCMWVSDLQFMVHWFCLISWRLFDGLMMYLRYWFSVTQILNWNYICRSVTYSLWSSDFALYLEDYLMDKYHSWNTGSIWCNILPHNMYVGQWATFHGPVILSYILKTTWWINVVLEIWS